MQKSKQPRQKEIKKKQQAKAKSEVLEPREEKQEIWPERTVETDLVLRYLDSTRDLRDSIRTIIGSMMDQSDDQIADTAGSIYNRFQMECPRLKSPFNALLSRSLSKIDWTDIAETKISEAMKDEAWLERRKIRKEKEVRDRERLDREREYE